MSYLHPEARSGTYWTSISGLSPRRPEPIRPEGSPSCFTWPSFDPIRVYFSPKVVCCNMITTIPPPPSLVPEAVKLLHILACKILFYIARAIPSYLTLALRCPSGAITVLLPLEMSRLGHKRGLQKGFLEVRLLYNPKAFPAVSRLSISL